MELWGLEWLPEEVECEDAGEDEVDGDHVVEDAWVYEDEDPCDDGEEWVEHDYLQWFLSLEIADTSPLTQGKSGRRRKQVQKKRGA